MAPMEPSHPQNAQVRASRDAERAGEIALAIREAEAALASTRHAGDAAGEALAAASLAYAHMRLGHYSTAHTILHQALVVSPPDSPERGEVLLNLGVCAAETNDIAAAEEYFRQAIDLGRQLGVPRLLARGVHSLAAGVHTPRGDFELAVAADEEAFGLARKHGLTDLLWHPASNLMWTCWLTGQHDRARHWLEELRAVALPGSLADGLGYLARAQLARQEGDFDGARKAFSEMRSIAEDRGLVELELLAREGLAQLCRAAGDASAALGWAADALAIAERTGYRHLQGRALIERGRAAWALGNHTQAEADFRAALAVLKPLQARFEVARAGMLLASLLTASQSPEADGAWREATADMLTGGYAFWVAQELEWTMPMLTTYLKGADPEARTAAARLQAALDALPPPALRIRTLGGFRLYRGGLPVSDDAWQRRKARQLLLYLVLRRRPVSRDELLEALWPDLPPSSAALALNTTFSDLRRIIEPHLSRGAPSRYIERDTETLTLRVTDGCWCDVWAFEQAVREGVSAAPQAMALYQGDFLPEEPYVDWVLRERERLRSLYLNALMTWLDERLGAKAWQEALDLARRIVALEPWLEEAWRALMLCLARLGRRSEALRAYQDCTRALRAELDVDPAPETRALFDQLRAQ